jgi:hypothetical protein
VEQASGTGVGGEFVEGQEKWIGVGRRNSRTAKEKKPKN